MKRIVAFALLVVAMPAAGSAQDWNKAKRVEIGMENFKFVPGRIVLRHGEAYVLHFVDRASGGHNFVAKNFFAAAHVAPSDSAKVVQGEIDLEGGESIDVRLIAPAAGAVYDVHCSHFMHRTFGMKGEIVVQ